MSRRTRAARARISSSERTKTAFRPCRRPRANRKCRPSGRKLGHRCCVSPRDSSSVVTGFGSPPAADTRKIGPASPANRISPFWFQAPPPPPCVLHRVCGVPPATSSFLSSPAAKNAMARPSGDQKGKEPPSVPGSCCADSESSSRSHNVSLPMAGAVKRQCACRRATRQGCRRPRTTPDRGERP